MCCARCTKIKNPNLVSPHLRCQSLLLHPITPSLSPLYVLLARSPWSWGWVCVSWPEQLLSDAHCSIIASCCNKITRALCVLDSAVVLDGSCSCTACFLNSIHSTVFISHPYMPVKLVLSLMAGIKTYHNQPCPLVVKAVLLQNLFYLSTAYFTPLVLLMYRWKSRHSGNHTAQQLKV